MDILCFKNKDLIPIELNLVILEILKDDLTNNVEILCPTNNYSSFQFNKYRDTVILIKQDNYYEPIYTYLDNDKGTLELQNIFNVKDKTLSNIKNLIFELQEYFKKCKPLPSLPSVYYFKENISLLLLKKYFSEIKNFILNHYVINYNGKVIGINITFDESTTGFLPCYPSNIPNDNSKLKFIDENNWNTYDKTVNF